MASVPALVCANVKRDMSTHLPIHLIVHSEHVQTIAQVMELAINRVESAHVTLHSEVLIVLNQLSVRIDAANKDDVCLASANVWMDSVERIARLRL